MVENERCEITGNPCGTDTWVIGKPCQCNPCQRYVARTTEGSIGLLGPDGKPIMASEVPPRSDPGWQTWIDTEGAPVQNLQGEDVTELREGDEVSVAAFGGRVRGVVSETDEPDVRRIESSCSIWTARKRSDGRWGVSVGVNKRAIRRMKLHGEPEPLTREVVDEAMQRGVEVFVEGDDDG